VSLPPCVGTVFFMQRDMDLIRQILFKMEDHSGYSPRANLRSKAIRRLTSDTMFGFLETQG
jgi:hypothetical protein